MARSTLLARRHRSLKLDEALVRATRAEQSSESLSQSVRVQIENFANETTRSATLQGKLNDALAETSGLEKRGKEREGHLKAVQSRLAHCEAKLAAEWEEQEACAAYKAANESCTHKSELQSVRLMIVEAAREAARADAATNDEAMKRADACAKKEAEVSERATKLAASNAALESEGSALRASSERAVSDAGSAVERAKLQKATVDECKKAAASTAKKVAKLETQLEAASVSNASCTEELGRYLRYVADDSALQSGALTRLALAVHHLISTDGAAAIMYARGVWRAATSTPTSSAEGGKATVSGQAGARVATLARSYAAATADVPPLVDVPVAARPLVYLLLLLLAILLRYHLRARRLERVVAADATMIDNLEARVRTMQVGAPASVPLASSPTGHLPRSCLHLTSLALTSSPSPLLRTPTGDPRCGSYRDQRIGYAGGDAR